MLNGNISIVNSRIRLEMWKNLPNVRIDRTHEINQLKSTNITFYCDTAGHLRPATLFLLIEMVYLNPNKNENEADFALYMIPRCWTIFANKNAVYFNLHMRRSRPLFQFCFVFSLHVSIVLAWTQGEQNDQICSFYSSFIVVSYNGLMFYLFRFF